MRLTCCKSAAGRQPKQVCLICETFVSFVTRSQSKEPMTIGVLAIQGDYEAHAAVLQRLGAAVKLVRKPEELDSVDALIIPGGESSTFLKFLEQRKFFERLAD